MRPLVGQMLPALKRGVIVTDVGSVKASVVRELESLIAGSGGHFIGSHPMVGSENRPERRLRRFFADAICLVTPTKNQSPHESAKLNNFGRRWFADAAVDAQIARRLGEPLQPFAACGRSQLANYVLSPANPRHQTAGLRQRFSRHHPHRRQFAGNVARHRAGQPQEHWQITGRLRR